MTKISAPNMERKQAQALVLNYLDNGIVDDFASVPFEAKLCILQVTPPKYIQKREVAGKEFKYIDHQYAKKCLNFAFNFNVSMEIKEQKLEKVTEKYWDYKHPSCKADQYGRKIPVAATREVFEATVVCGFTFKDKDGNEIKKDVISSQKQYPSAATNSGDCLKGAVSKAYTLVAATFGIGAELDIEREQDFDMPAEEVEATVKEVPPTKSFATPPITDVGY